MSKFIKIHSKKEKLGTVITTVGASGGVTYKPMMSKEEATEVVNEVITLLEERTFVTWRVFILSDLVGNPSLLNKVGKLIASIYMEEKLDAVVTIATKGISLANAVANILNSTSSSD